jgi:hypothetical protein
MVIMGCVYQDDVSLQRTALARNDGDEWTVLMDEQALCSCSFIINTLGRGLISSEGTVAFSMSACGKRACIELAIMLPRVFRNGNFSAVAGVENKLFQPPPRL